MEDDSGKSWRSPVRWPPTAWRWTSAHQIAADLVLVILGIAFVVIAVSAIAALFVLPVQALTALFKEQHETARNYLLALGALLGVPFLIWRTLIAARQASISRESLYTQLFASGVERLGAEKTVKFIEETHLYRKNGDEWARNSDGNPIPALRPDGKQIVEYKTHERTVLNIENRLGAVYALERVSIDSKRDNAAITRTLASYVKNNINASAAHGDGDIAKRTDVQAAISVLSRIHRPLASDPALDISGVDFKAFSFDSGEFHNCDFSHSKSFGMKLHKTILKKCQLTESEWIKSTMTATSLLECTFDDAKFDDLETTISQFSGCFFERSKIRRYNCNNTNFKDSLFIYCDFTDAVFKDCIFSNIEFDRSNLRSARFENCIMENVTFSSCDMTTANIIKTEVRNVSVFQSNVTALKHPAELHISIVDNFYASDEWLNSTIEEVKYFEVALIKLNMAWNDWLESRKSPPN